MLRSRPPIRPPSSTVDLIDFERIEFLKPFQANYASKKKTFEATKKRKKEERDADGKLDPEELAQMLNDLPQEQERIQSTRSYAKYTALTQSIWSKGAPRM